MKTLEREKILTLLISDFPFIMKCQNIKLLLHATNLKCNAKAYVHLALILNVWSLWTEIKWIEGKCHLCTECQRYIKLIEDKINNVFTEISENKNILARQEARLKAVGIYEKVEITLNTKIPFTRVHLKTQK